MGKVIDFFERCISESGEVHYAWPSNICALCEIEFDNELSYTDGEAYFCEECAQELSEVFKRDE